MSRRLRPLSAAVAATLLLSLTACGEEPSPPRPPSINIQMPSDGGGDTAPSDGGGEAAPSDGGGEEGSEGEPTVAAPDVPAPNPDDYPNRDLRTPEGAEQAVKYYFSLVYWGLQTGDSKGVESRHEAGCTGCEFFDSSIEEVRKTGQYWGSVYPVEVESGVHESDRYEYEVKFQYTLQAHVIASPGGSEPRQYPESEIVSISGVDWVDGGWVIRGMYLENVSGDA